MMDQSSIGRGCIKSGGYNRYWNRMYLVWWNNQLLGENVSSLMDQSAIGTGLFSLEDQSAIGTGCIYSDGSISFWNRMYLVWWINQLLEQDVSSLVDQSAIGTGCIYSDELISNWERMYLV